MNAIGYNELIQIHDEITVYSNTSIQLSVQSVNNKYLFIEIEDENEYTGKHYNNINDMINDLKTLNLNCDYNNFYVKKAELVFNDTYNVR